MPGLVGYVSLTGNDHAQVLDRMIAAIMHEPYVVTYGKTTVGAFACAHHGKFNHPVKASIEDGNVGLLLDGWIFGDGNNLPSFASHRTVSWAEYCLKAYLEHGLSFVKNLNGHFNILLWDVPSRSISVLNDRYGIRPLQYAKVKDKLFFAPEGKAIFSTGCLSKELNLRMLVNQLSWGRIWIGQETLFRNISLLPPASCLHWQDGKLTLERYWDYAYDPEPEVNEEFIDASVQIFQRAVRRHIQAPLRYGVSLTGGLDSRTVLAALAKQNLHARAYTWGVSEHHDEVTIARRSAEKLGVSWEYVPLSPADFILHAQRGLYLTEGLDLMVQSHGLKIYPLLRHDTDALLTGLALDLSLGGSYLTPDVANNGDVSSRRF